MNNPKHPISRKEIAQLLDVSVRVVADNERRWGLDRMRFDYNPRMVRYSRQLVLAMFRQKRWIS